MPIFSVPMTDLQRFSRDDLGKDPHEQRVARYVRVVGLLPSVKGGQASHQGEIGQRIVCRHPHDVVCLPTAGDLDVATENVFFIPREDADSHPLRQLHQHTVLRCLRSRQDHALQLFDR